MIRSAMMALALMLACLTPAWSGEMVAGTNPRVAAYFVKARQNQAELVAFLHKMPKGADLHNHPAGAVYGETLVRLAAEQGLYFDRENKAFTKDLSAGSHFTPDELRETYWKTGEVLEAVSLRNLHLSGESGHDHFFRSFDRFTPVLPNGEMPIVKEVIARAARQRVAYLELMMVAGTDPAWRLEFERACEEARAEAGRDIEVRISYPLLRLVDADGFRPQVEAAFAAAAAWPDLVVGVTILAPEDDWASQEHFAEHMAILGEAVRRACALHREDPVHNPPPPRLNLHAGELTVEIATYESMTDRISTTIGLGRASRIGHGTSVMWEDDVYGTLKRMRDCRIAVEFCPSSAEEILGVSGDMHPFPLYWAAGVPVVIGTDDEGVARSNLTLEYAKAARWFGLSYGEIKWLSFAGLEYSFLPGQSLFVGGNFNHVSPDLSLLQRSRKAAMQQRLLDEFDAFERDMVGVLDTFGW